MMPAGKYYIGDLCYVMGDEEWDDFCGVTISGNECLQGEFEMPDGRKFATYSTAWGDGLYKDQYGNRYGVDAGLIGCIKLDDIKADKYSNIEDLGSVFEFKEDFTTSGGRGDRDWDGVIRIGNVRINTDPSGDEFEEDYE